MAVGLQARGHQGQTQRRRGTVKPAPAPWTSGHICGRDKRQGRQKQGLGTGAYFKLQRQQTSPIQTALHSILKAGEALVRPTDRVPTITLQSHPGVQVLLQTLSHASRGHEPPDGPNPPPLPPTQRGQSCKAQQPYLLQEPHGFLVLHPQNFLGA